MDDIIDLVSLSDEELEPSSPSSSTEEREISRQRRILHGKLDILRAELVHAPAAQAHRRRIGHHGRRRRRAVAHPRRPRPGDMGEQAPHPVTRKARAGARREGRAGRQGRARGLTCSAPSAAIKQLGGRELLRPLRGEPDRRAAGSADHDELLPGERRRGQPAGGAVAGTSAMPRHPQRRRPCRRDLRARGERTTIGRHPDCRHLPRRRHRVAQPRRRRPRGRAYMIADRGQPQRHLRQPAAHRATRHCSTATSCRSASTSSRSSCRERKAELLFDVGDEKLLTIGAVVDRLRAEFPDVSA